MSRNLNFIECWCLPQLGDPVEFNKLLQDGFDFYNSARFAVIPLPSLSPPPLPPPPRDPLGLRDCVLQCFKCQVKLTITHALHAIRYEFWGSLLQRCLPITKAYHNNVRRTLQQNITGLMSWLALMTELLLTLPSGLLETYPQHCFLHMLFLFVCFLFLAYGARVCCSLWCWINNSET